MQQETAPASIEADERSYAYRKGGLEGGTNFLSLTFLRALLWRQRIIIVGAIVAALVAGWIYTMLLTPMFTATATMRVNTQDTTVIEGQEISDPYIQSNEINNYMQTLVTVARSRRIAEAVANQLDENTLRRLTGMEDADQARLVARSRVRSSVSVDAPRQARIVNVSSTMADAELARRVADAYVNVMVTDSITGGVENNAAALEYLAGQVEEVRESLREAEIAANEYARSNGIFSEGPQSASETTTGNSSSITGSNLSSINAAYMNARAQRIAAEQEWRAISDLPVSQLPAVRDDPTIQAMRSRLAELDSRLAELRERYQDDYPEIREVRAEIATLNSRLSETSTGIRDGLRGEYLIALRQEQALADERQRLSDATLNEQDRRVQYNILTREAQALRNQLEALLSRYNQISSAANIENSDLSVLDYAVAPGSPSSPDFARNMMLALLAGLGLAAALAVLREFFDDRMHTLEDVEARLGVPALGQTPYSPGEVDDSVANQFSALSEAYSSIRATLDYALPDSKPAILQVTSSQPSEGKSTTASALARKFAASNKRTLLIDGDLRRPSVHKMFDVSRRDYGLIDALYSRVPVERAIMSGVEDNLDLLMVSKVPPNPVEILSSGLLPQLIKHVSDSYDVILIDSSPVIGIADAPLTSRLCDATIMVVEAGRAHHGQARAAIRRLLDADAFIVGAVLTKFRALEAGQSYNYQYRYYNYESEQV